MIRAVLFDLDGTLYDRDASILQVVDEQFRAFGEELRHVDKGRFIERLLELDSHGHNRTPDLHRILAEELGFARETADGLEAYFRAYYHRHCRLLPDTVSTLQAIRANGKKLGIITNGPIVWQSRKLDALGLVPFFDTILISEAEGIHKPDPRIFARAVERCGALPSESVYVGDHPEADIAGARSAGLIPIWKRRPYWQVPDDVISVDRLAEILPFCLGE